MVGKNSAKIVSFEVYKGVLSCVTEVINLLIW